MRFKSLLALGVLVGACSGSQFETTDDLGGSTGGVPGTGGNLNGSGGGPRSTGGLAGKSGGAANSGGSVGAATGGVPSGGGNGTETGGTASGGDAGVIQPGTGGAVTASGGSGAGSDGGAIGTVGGGFSGVGGSAAGGSGGFASGGSGGFASGGSGGTNCNSLWYTYAQALEKARSCTLDGQNQCGTDKGLPDACGCEVPVNSGSYAASAANAYDDWVDASCQHSVVCLMPCTSIQSSVCTATSNGGAICKPSSGPSSG